MRWNEQLATGISTIDDEHRRMLEQIDIMLAASRASETASVQLSLAEFDNHVREHFRVEETAMRAAKYPEVATHAAQHSILRSYANDLRRAVSAYGAQPDVLEVAARLVANAIVSHMELYDRELAAFLRLERA